jgi:predicted ATPase/DNA-binding winged helix-turn-helix (wHTH) protein
MTHAEPARQQFGAIEVRAAERQLIVDGQAVSLGARAFDVLLALVERRERTVSKAELLELVWPDRVVEDNNLQVHIWALRKVLGAATIATIAGQGYRFVAPSPTPADERQQANVEAGPVVAPSRLLFGRDDALAELRALLAVHRLVSVVGPDGIGKSALVHTLLQTMRGEFNACPALIDMASPNAREQTKVALAEVSQTRFAANDIAPAPAGAGWRLIVLDNCERERAPVSEVAQLLKTSPRVKVLVTGQEPLMLQGEQVYRLDALALPPQGQAATASQARSSGAVQLFEQRARAANWRFELTDDNVAAVVEICTRLEGVALAIELAAARLTLLGVEGLRARIDESARPVDVDAPAAQRTLPAAHEWSDELLPPLAQTVLRRLAVLAGGFDLAAAQGVAADAALDEWAVLDELGELANRSVLVAEQTPGAELRYRLLNPVHRWAMNALITAGELEATRRRHLMFFVAFAERAHALSAGPGQRRAQQLLTPEADNLAAALQACDESEQGAELGLRLVDALSVFWFQQGLIDQGHRATLRALARPGAGALTPLRARALLRAGWFCAELGRDLDAAPLLSQSVEIGRACDAPESVCEALVRLGGVRAALQDRAGGRVFIDQALALTQRTGVTAATVLAVIARADFERHDGRLATAQALGVEGLRHARALGDCWLTLAALNSLAATTLGAGVVQGVRALLREAMEICDEFGWQRARLDVMQVCAALAVRSSQPALALALDSAAEVHSPGFERRCDGPDAVFLAPLIAAAGTALGPQACDRARDAGRGWACDDAVRQMRDGLHGA